MSESFKKIVNTLPKVLNPEFNRVLYALMSAIAASDDDVQAAIAEGKNQLFVPTATGSNLDKLANSKGVQRPATLGLSDSDFQALIPNLTLKPKNIRKAFYDTADVFWGPLFSRANVNSLNSAPYNISAGDSLSVSIDHGATQIIKVLSGDVATPGAATALEVQTLLSRIKGVTVSIRVDSLTGNEFINIRTNTPGPVGAVQINDSSLITSNKLNIGIGSFNILNLDQRVAVYNINPNELLIELPSIVPALRRTLRGSHHFHADSTIESPVAPTNGIWQGSFFYDPTGTQSTYTISNQRSGLQQTIQKGQIYTSLAVDSNSSFLAPSGSLVFGFGTAQEEGPVTYRGIPNTSTILVDPSYTFKFDHSNGTVINVISQKKPFVPNTNGSNLAIYLTSPSGARAIVQDILASLAAAGITVVFQILAPKYKYLISNPYTDFT